MGTFPGMTLSSPGHSGSYANLYLQKNPLQIMRKRNGACVLVVVTSHEQLGLLIRIKEGPMKGCKLDKRRRIKNLYN